MVVVGASLFSGCGAADLGYEAGGVNVLYACEILAPARATFELNLGRPVAGRDVNDVHPDQIVAACGRVPDLLVASPPCNSYSFLGRRELDSIDAKLYWQAVRIARELEGLGLRGFVFENVRAFASGRAYGRQFAPILAALRRLPYHVATQRVDSSWLGVPQARERVFVVGVHRELGVRAPLLRRDPVRAAIRDALPDAARIVALPARQYGTTREERTWPASGPAPTITGGGMAERNWPDLRVELLDGRRRRFSLADLMVLSGFPAGFRFPAGVSESAARKMIGRCVPPPVTERWGRAFTERLTGDP